MTDDEAEHNRAMLDLEIKNLSNMGKQLEIPFEETKVSPKYWKVPFVDEVQEFNETFGKPNNYEPTIPEKKATNGLKIAKIGPRRLYVIIILSTPV